MLSDAECLRRVPGALCVVSHAMVVSGAKDETKRCYGPPRASAG